MKLVFVSLKNKINVMGKCCNLVKVPPGLLSSAENKKRFPALKTSVSFSGKSVGAADLMPLRVKDRCLGTWWGQPGVVGAAGPPSAPGCGMGGGHPAWPHPTPASPLSPRDKLSLRNPNPGGVGTPVGAPRGAGGWGGSGEDSAVPQSGAAAGSPNPPAREELFVLLRPRAASKGLQSRLCQEKLRPRRADIKHGGRSHLL